MNKTILFIALLLVTSSGMVHAKDGLQQFYTQHRADKNVQQIRLSQFLLRLAATDREARTVLRHLKSLKIFQMDEPNDKRQPVMDELTTALTQDGFESLMQVTDDGDRVNIYIRQDRKKIRHVLITVDSRDEIVLLQARTKISFDQLNAMMSDYKSGNNKSGLNKIIHYKG